MSAYLSMLTREGGYLFTDGAAYDDEGVVGAFISKVCCAERMPFAVTVLGNNFVGARLMTVLPKLVDEVGNVDAFLEVALPAFLDEIKNRENIAELTTGSGAACAHMVAFSETKGLIHFNFQTFDEVDQTNGEQVAAYKIRMVSNYYAARGTVVDPAKVSKIRPAAQGETLDTYIRYFGSEVMELMRQEKGCTMHLKGTQTPLYHTVGGHIDMTLITEAGARTERIKVWDDKIGQKIVPQQAFRTVTAFPGVSRQQRRAAERAARKTA